MWRHRVCVTAAVAQPVCSGPQSKDGLKFAEHTKEKTEILGGCGDRLWQCQFVQNVKNLGWILGLRGFLNMVQTTEEIIFFLVFFHSFLALFPYFIYILFSLFCHISISLLFSLCICLILSLLFLFISVTILLCPCVIKHLSNV